MKFKLRSMSEKLIGIAAIILLLCILLFAWLSLFFLRYLSERDARRESLTHLSLVSQAYSQQTVAMLQNLSGIAQDNAILATIAQNHHSSASLSQAQESLALVSYRHHAAFHKLDIIDADHRLAGQLEDGRNVLADGGASLQSLINDALQDKATSTLLMLPRSIKTAAAAPSAPSWTLVFAVPILHRTHAPVGVLVAELPLDNTFAQSLLQSTSNLNIILCQGDQVLGTTVRWEPIAQALPNGQLCAPDVSLTYILNGQERFLTRSEFVQSRQQSVISPSLVIVDIEPIDNINLLSVRSLEILGQWAFSSSPWASWPTSSSHATFLFAHCGPCRRVCERWLPVIVRMEGQAPERRATKYIPSQTHSTCSLNPSMCARRRALP